MLRIYAFADNKKPICNKIEAELRVAKYTTLRWFDMG